MPLEVPNKELSNSVLSLQPEPEVPPELPPPRMRCCWAPTAVLDGAHETLNLPARTCRDPIWAAGGSNLQQLVVFKTAGVSYLDFLNNQYKLLFFILICKCSSRRITNTSPTVCHPSVHTWPPDYLILGTAGALTGAFEVGVKRSERKDSGLTFWGFFLVLSHILYT